MAGNWAYNAANDGWYVSDVPVKDSIVVWQGHVGYVYDINEDGTWMRVIEGGWAAAIWTPGMRYLHIAAGAKS